MLAQAYHWTLDEIKRLTYPQVIMLQAAASYNRKVLDAKLDEKRDSDKLSPTEALADGARDITQMSSEEIILMAGTESGRAPKVIKLKKDTPNEHPEPES